MKKIHSLLVYIPSLFILLFSLFPIYWMLVTSLRNPIEIFSPSIIVLNPTLENYIGVITQTHYLTTLFYRQLFNTIIIALGSTILALLVSTTCSYAIARINFIGSRIVQRMAIFTYIIPYSFLAIPFFRMMVYYGLINSYMSVIIAVTTFTSPFCIWVLSEHFREIPTEILEAALIDGVSKAQAFVRIMLPLSTSMLAALATYVFLFAWNELLYVLILTSGAEMFTLPLGLMWFLASDTIPWGLLMAESTIYSIPPIIFYYATRKYMVKGLLSGAIKR